MRRVSGRKGSESGRPIARSGAAKISGSGYSPPTRPCSTLITSSPGNGTTLSSALFGCKRWRLGLASNSEPSQIWSRTEADLGRKKCRVLDHDRLR